MYTTRNEKIRAEHKKVDCPQRGNPLALSRGYGSSFIIKKKWLWEDSFRKQTIVTIFVFSILCSIIFQFPLQAKADPDGPIPLEEEGEYKTTWKFSTPQDYNTTETEIIDEKVSLKIHSFTWNQITKSDFNKGTKVNISVSEKSATETIWSDHFDSSGPGAGWEHAAISGGVDQWQYGSVLNIPSFIGPYDGGDYVWGTNLIGKYTEPGLATDYYLKSETIDLSNTDKPELSFWHYYVFENDTSINDGGIVEVSTDNGGTWEQISPTGAGYDGIIGDPANPLYNPDPPTGSFGGNSSDWVQARFDLSKYDDEENFTFRFRFATNGAVGDYGWYLDDVVISGTPYSFVEVTLSPGNMVIGNEPVNSVQRPSNVTVIDANNPASMDGILTEWVVFVPNVLINNSTGAMRIFRRVGNNFSFISETNFETLVVGQNQFECNLSVKAGDYIGWYSEGAEIWGVSGGVAYSLSGNESANHPVSNWTQIVNSYSIRATGFALNPTGILSSQVFDAGSEAIWDEIRWSEDITASVTDIVVQVRSGNPFGETDISWNQESPFYLDPAGSQINIQNGRFFQFNVTLTSTNSTQTPILFNVSVSYRKYATEGEVETRDFVPDFVVKWLDFSASDIESGQTIEYSYSTDSGSTWDAVPTDGNLRSVSVLPKKMRLKIRLFTDDTTVSPSVIQFSLSYYDATPEMTIFIETEKDTAISGDTISIKIWRHNIGISNAENITITFFMDSNLIYKDTNTLEQPSLEIRDVTKIVWELDTPLAPGKNTTFTVDAKVKDLDVETDLVCYAFINYSDIGGNKWVNVESNTLTVKASPQTDIFTIILFAALIAIILIIIIVFLIKRYKSQDEANKKISLDKVERGIGYLVIEDNPTRSYTLFSDLIDYGYSGLCITRTFPGRVKSNYSFDDVSILWLSRARDEDSIVPSNLGAVLRSVKDFMEESDSSVILLDGLEYLIVHNDFQRVLKLVHIINEMAAINNSVVIMPLNPITLDEGKVALLKRDLKLLS